MSLPFTPGELSRPTDSVGIKIVRAAARIMVIRRKMELTEYLFVRHPRKGLELPGGAMEPGENPAQTALRELGEEAGLLLPPDQPLSLLGIYPLQDPRGGSWIDIIYSTELTSVAVTVSATSPSPIPKDEPTVCRYCSDAVRSGDATQIASLNPPEFEIVWLALSEVREICPKKLIDVIGLNHDAEDEALK